MSTSCFEMSTEGNVLFLKRKCGFLCHSDSEHSIYGNTWILSNTKNIYRWHVSIPNASILKIGISNNCDDKQTYLFECEDLSTDSMQFPLFNYCFQQDGIDESDQGNNAIITLTLDLKSNPATLYCFKNGDTSSEQHINIPTENNIKYKFSMKKISICNMASNTITVFKTVITHTSLFENYNLNSVTNIVPFARHTANCLVHGYITNNATLTIPQVIKELCAYYFVGGKHFMEDLRQDLLGYLDTKSKRELFALILNVIFPGNENIALMLQQLIDFCHQFNHADFIKENNYFHKRKKSFYFSILISLTHVIDFHQILNKIESKTNYNYLILKIASSEGELGIQLLCNLLKQNSKYYPLYKQCVWHANTAYSMRQYVFSICQKRSDILYLRQILLPFIYRDGTDTVDVNSNGSVLISFLLGKLAADRSLSPWLTTIWFEEIQWLWLNKEVNVMASLGNKYSEQYLLSIIFKILTQIQRMDLILPEEQLRCAKIAIGILRVISEMKDLNVEYEINNLNAFLEVVTMAFRSNENDIIGWKILNKEINKLLMDKHYTYYNDWIVYIESKCGLMKSNFINNIKIIKNKCDGNKERAHKSLEIAAKTCYNINKLQSFKLKKFAALYAKITQTKLLKPILGNL